MSDIDLYRDLLALDYELRACIEKTRQECIADGIDAEPVMSEMRMARAIVLSVLDEYGARCAEERHRAECEHPGIIYARDIEAEIWRLYYGGES